MEGPLALGLHVLADTCGFVGSILLLATAWWAVPLQSIIDIPQGTDPNKPGTKYIVVAQELAKTDLSCVHAGERRYMIFGAGFLASGFLCSIMAHFA